MRPNRKTWGFALVVSLSLVSGLAAPALAQSATTTRYRHAAAHHHSSAYRGALRPGLSYAYEPRRSRHGHGTGFVDLVGDPGSGYGFYNLPTPIRVAALRYRLRHTPPPWYNPVQQAVAADAVRYWYDPIPANRDYAYGVFNPYDGVGTPFFAGYYGPASEDDERPFPFGAPYTD